MVSLLKELLIKQLSVVLITPLFKYYSKNTVKIPLLTLSIMYNSYPTSIYTSSRFYCRYRPDCISTKSNKIVNVINKCFLSKGIEDTITDQKISEIKVNLSLSKRS